LAALPPKGRLAAVRPSDEERAALERVAARRGPPLVVADSRPDFPPDSAPEIPSDAGFLFLGRGAALDGPPPCLVLAADAGALPAHDEATIVAVRLAPAADAPSVGLGVPGVPSADALAAVAALEARSRQERPTEPVHADVGRLLHLLVRAARARRVLEVGTSAGAAAVWLASALPTGGQLVTVERDSAPRQLAQRAVRRAGLADRVDLRLGDAARLLPRLAGPFDLVFLDEEPLDRADDLAAVLPLCAPGALLVSHGAEEHPVELARYAALVRTLPGLSDSIGLSAGGGLLLTRVAA
jgi:predicted O-methyltransferase YrrM